MQLQKMWLVPMVSAAVWMSLQGPPEVHAGASCYVVEDTERQKADCPSYPHLPFLNPRDI